MGYKQVNMIGNGSSFEKFAFKIPNDATDVAVQFVSNGIRE
jgi:hypothetical protein